LVGTASAVSAYSATAEEDLEFGPVHYLDFGPADQAEKEEPLLLRKLVVQLLGLDRALKFFLHDTKSVVYCFQLSKRRVSLVYRLILEAYDLWNGYMDKFLSFYPNHISPDKTIVWGVENKDLCIIAESTVMICDERKSFATEPLI
jgi:hypothetical protein